MQDAVVSSGKNAGKRVNELEPFRAALISSPQHYSATTGNRPDMAVDIMDSAEKRTGLSYKTVTPGSTDYGRLEQARLSETLERLTPEQVERSHYGLFDDIGIHGNSAYIDKVTGGTIAHPVTGAPMTISDVFAQKLIDFKAAPGVSGKNAVGALFGGKQPHADAALAHAINPVTGLPYDLTSLP